MLLKDLIILLFLLCININAEKYYSKEDKLRLREQVREMFYHGYDNYLRYANDFDELRPLTCDGIDTWGSYSLTLIDALDTLAIMGNYSEFQRVVGILEQKLDFDRDINVSVFETNIRVVGGLLSAHLFSKRAGIAVEKGWPCQGPLLRLAEDLAKRLLPAFDTFTGMPYGTVNLRYGVPKGETSVTCTACVGTFLIEFSALSRLTGNSIYEEVALNAIYALWERRSQIGLFGNHIDVQTGRWTALDSGIGAGVDSFFEYLVKGATMLNQPHLLSLFNEARVSIDKYLKREDWYVWVNMNKGQVTLPVFQSLEAFWPGVLSLIGDTSSAMRTLIKYSGIWDRYGFLPEFYNIATMQVSANRENYPLRPELVESLWYLYRSTNNQFLLEMAERMLNTINFSARTKCGYATIRNVITHEKENRMESFFLAETTKYFYLLFDEDNFIHKQGSGDIIETKHGKCLANAGGYVFNTEAHPIDMSALYCCHDLKEDIFEGLNLNQFSDATLLYKERKELTEAADKKMLYSHCTTHRSGNKQEQNTKFKENSDITVDIEVYDEDNHPMGDALVYNFDKIVQAAKHSKMQNENTKERIVELLNIRHLVEFFKVRREDFESPEATLQFVINFMKNNALNSTSIKNLNIQNKMLSNMLESEASRSFSLWDLYIMHQRASVNKYLVRRFIFDSEKEENVKILKSLLIAIKGIKNTTDDLSNDMSQKIKYIKRTFEQQLVNTTAMQKFLAQFTLNDTLAPFKYHILLEEEEIQALDFENLNEMSTEIFDQFQHTLELKLQMIKTFERLQELVDNTTANSSTSIKVLENKEDIKVMEDSNFEVEDPLHLNQTLNVSNIENNTKKSSVWQQLIQTILRNTVAQPEKFDEQELHKKIREHIDKYVNLQETAAKENEVLSCSRPKFLEQFSYRNKYILL